MPITGDVGLYVGTRPDNLAEAVATIAQELEHIGEDPATPQELSRSRENLKGRIVLSLESTVSRMNRLGGSLLSGLPILSVDEIIDRIDAVEVEDLRELASRNVRARRSLRRVRGHRRGCLPQRPGAIGGSGGMIRATGWPA